MTAGDNTLRAIVVDDEQLAREELCFLLGQLNDVEVVGQAGNGIEALKVVDEQSPDLVMLDVQMPGLTGFEVARRLLRAGVEAHFVFVTAFDQHVRVPGVPGVAGGFGCQGGHGCWVPRVR